MANPRPFSLRRRQLLAIPLTLLCPTLPWPWNTPVGLRLAAAFSSDRKQSSKERLLTQERPTTVSNLASATVIKDENVYFLCRPDGTIPMSGHHGFGLYLNDCRFLNGYQLHLNEDHEPRSLTATAHGGHSAMVQLTNPPLRSPDGEELKTETIGIGWERVIESRAHALHDRLTVRNFGRGPATLTLTLGFRAEFDDIYVIRGLVGKNPGSLQAPQWTEKSLSFHYVGQDGFHRSVTIYFSPFPSDHGQHQAKYNLNLEPDEAKTVHLSLVLRESKKQAEVPDSDYRMPDLARLRSHTEEEKRAWLAQVPDVTSDSELLQQSLDRSFRDLRVLQSRLGEETYFSAGVPWFATLFGRDSLITAIQLLAFDTRIAEGTLRLLAKRQGQKDDEWQDEAPGKILHELRTGELARLGRIPHTPYYGTVDATPLFLILMGLYLQWTADMKLFKELEDAVQQALMWIERYGDRNGDGYVEYRANPPADQESDMARLINKGWKDSGNAIVNEDGSLAGSPISLVEVQGYVYLAKRLMAEVFERVGNGGQATQLRHEAEQLSRRFNQDFWLDGKGLYALALQRDGKVASVVASNAGHALWSGIAETEKARRTVERLMQEDMFSGWGVRTLASTERSYNPIGYHLGTVWPHDNSIIAAGCRRYGHDDAALRIFDGILHAASHFDDHQLPELFCGFERGPYPRPVQYPVANHPQAWAAGSVPYLLTTILGLEAHAFEHRLVVRRPVLPPFITQLEIMDIQIGRERADLRFERKKDRVKVIPLNKSSRLEIDVQQS